jgi:hypothetical protein
VYGPDANDEPLAGIFELWFDLASAAAAAWRSPTVGLNAPLTKAAEHLVDSQAEWARAWIEARADLSRRADAGD